jgi:acyl-coenzyme A synthetase/AMP-(fatty) acid ligase
MVNIGGVKVWPEEVEAHILALDCVADVLVSPRANPVTGHILVAEIVLAAGAMPDIHEAQIKKHVMDLPRAARPAMIRYKTHLDTGQTGKKARAGGA